MYPAEMEHKPLRTTRTVVLIAAALMEQPHDKHWGYALARRAGVSSNALYQVVRRFHQRGWLADGWEEVDPDAKRPPRRYYTITPDGMARLSALLLHAARDRRFEGLNLTPGLAR
jgi:PadR family transcriptional regulator PadR